MKCLFVLLLPFLVVLQACHKTDTKRVIFPYDQTYMVSYDKDIDSMLVYAGISNKYSSDAGLKNGDAIYVNGKEAEVMSSNGASYDWEFKGLHDLQFDLIKDGNTIRNNLNAIDVKTYDFVDVPDTMSLSKVYQAKWQGPGRVNGEGFYFNLLFSNGRYIDSRLDAQNDDSIALSFPYFSNTSIGEATMSLSWTKEFPLQQIDADGDGVGGGSISCATRIKKKIWIIP